MAQSGKGWKSAGNFNPGKATGRLTDTGEKFGSRRLERASGILLSRTPSPSYGRLKSILEKNLDVHDSDQDVSTVPVEAMKKSSGAGSGEARTISEAAAMLSHETVNRLRYMKLTGMADSLKEQDDDSAYQEMGFYDRLGLMVDREFTKRQHSRLQRLVSRARFQNTTACVEDIRYDDDRRLDRGFIMELASCNYIPHARNVLVIGPTGAGKSFLAQALGQAACRHMLTTRYVQLPDLLDELKIAKRRDLEAFNRLRKQIVKFDLLIIDEWLLFPISEEDSEILLSIIDRRHNNKATIVASQYEPAEWLDQIPTAVVAEAITDRLASQAYRIIIRGSKSMRETIRE